jgi:hypothetical protein
MKIIDQIDRDRGDISRSRYVLRMIEKFYGIKRLDESQEQNAEGQQINSRGQPRGQSAVTSVLSTRKLQGCVSRVGSE